MTDGEIYCVLKGHSWVAVDVGGQVQYGGAHLYFVRCWTCGEHAHSYVGNSAGLTIVSQPEFEALLGKL